MFNINANCEAMSYGYNAINKEFYPIGEVEFPNGCPVYDDEYIGLYPCSCCNDIQVHFYREWDEGDIDAAIVVASIKDVKEFASCTTIEECQKVVDAILNEAIKAA